MNEPTKATPRDQCSTVESAFTPGGGSRLSHEELNRLSEWLDRLHDVPVASRHIWFRNVSESSALVLDALWQAILEDHPQAIEGEQAFLRPVNLGLGLEALSPDVAPGTMIGPYVLMDKIGEGGMGVVWRARREDVMRNRVVALKLPDTIAANDEARERLAGECDILAELSHPGIARLYDASLSPEGLPYLALEYIDGQTLVDYVRLQGLDLDQTLWLFVEILDALEHAHRKNIVHLDLKPSNVLVTRKGRPILLDFGIARILGGSERVTDVRRYGTPVTLAYAAPELLSGAGASRAADIYSLGVLLYQALTGRRPYSVSGSHGSDVADLIRQSRPDPPSVAVLNAPGRDAPARRALSRRIRGRLDAIVLRAMSPDPEARHQSAAALRAELVACIRRPHGRIASSALSGAGVELWPRWGTALAAAGILIASYVGLSAVSSRDRRQDVPVAASTGALDLSLDLLAEGLAMPLRERGASAEEQIATLRETVEGIRRRYADAGIFTDRAVLDLYGRIANIMLRSGRSARALLTHELRVGMARDMAVAGGPLALASSLIDAAEACHFVGPDGPRCAALLEDASREAQKSGVRADQQSAVEGRIELAKAFADAFENPEAASESMARADAHFRAAKDDRFRGQWQLVQGIIEGSNRRWLSSLAQLQESARRLDKAHPLYPLLQANLCETFHRIGDLRSAESTCSAALLSQTRDEPGLGPFTSQIIYQLGAIRMTTGDFESATSILLDGIRRSELAGADSSPTQTDPLYELLVRVAMARGDLDQAAVYVSKLPADRQSIPSAWGCSFDSLIERLAQQSGAAVSSRGPSKPASSAKAQECQTLLKEGSVHQLLNAGQWSEALQEIERQEGSNTEESRAINPNDGFLDVNALEVSIWKADALLQLGRARESMAIVKRLQHEIQQSADSKAYKVFSMDLSALLGRLLLRDGDHVGAVHWLEDAHEASTRLLSPKSPRRLGIVCHLAMAHLMANNHASALVLRSQADRIVDLNRGQLSRLLLAPYRQLMARMQR